MEMIMCSRSFRINEGPTSSSSWKRLERQNSLLLASELATVEFSRVTAYQKLSQSVRLTNEYGGCKAISITSKHAAAWRYLGKVFSLKRKGGRGQVMADAAAKPPEMVAQVVVVKKKKRSSWLPDPNRRWPVQGW